MNTLYKFIVFSSVDPKSISLTLKAAIPFLTTVLVYSFGWTEVRSVDFVNDIIAIIAGAFTLYGLIRKVLLTLEGNNKTLNKK